VKITVEKGDFKILRQISGFGLFSCEAKYHASCRKVYARYLERGVPATSIKWRSKLLLMGPTWKHSIGCGTSSTKQLMSLTAKVEKLSNMFSKLQSESEKLKKKSRIVRHIRNF